MIGIIQDVYSLYTCILSYVFVFQELMSIVLLQDLYVHASLMSSDTTVCTISIWQ